MAQQQRNVHVAAPGFAGVNTQQSPTELGAQFASVADNAVIDRFGRVGVRKGFNIQTVDNTPLGGEPLKSLLFHGDGSIFSAGNGKVFSGASLVDITPAATTIATDYWTIVSFNKRCYFFGEGNTPIVYDDTTLATTTLAAHPSFTGTLPVGHIAMGAFGRLWVGSGDILRWSDALNGAGWTGGSSGSIDLNLVWPNGYDRLTAIAEHNNFLVLFGTKSIILYSGASDPATMTLADTISGMGCVSEFAVASTGADLMFIDYTGVRSLGRTIQEKSVPIGDISANVRNDIKTMLLEESINGNPIRLVFAAEESFLLAVFTSQSLIYCFDMRGFLENGAARTTIWPSSQAWSGTTDPTTGSLYVGGYLGVSLYSGFTDGPTSIPFRYYSNPMTFDAPVNLKFLKQVDVTVIGGSGVSITLAWAYDYRSSFKKKVAVLSNSSLSLFGESEYNVTASEYSSGAILETEQFNTNGSGTSVTVGLEADVNGSAFSLQQLNFQALLGRIL